MPTDTPLTPRAFDLGDILSVTTGILMSPRRIDGIYDILNFLTGDSLFTHQLPRACRQCRPEVLRQHPQLADVTLEAMGADDVGPTLARLKSQYGETLPLTPLVAYEGMDPIEELMSMTDKPIIAVKIDD